MNLLFLLYFAIPLLNGMNIEGGRTPPDNMPINSSVYIEVATELTYVPYVDIVTIIAAYPEAFNLLSQATVASWFGNKPAYISSLSNQATIEPFQVPPAFSREMDLASDQFYARFVFVNAGAQSKKVYVGQSTYIEIYIDGEGVDVVYWLVRSVIL